MGVFLSHPGCETVTTPVITIFVRHSPGSKYAGDEFTKRCTCRKHFRWTAHGKQYRRKAGTRSWAEAEDLKRKLEDQLAGRVPAAPESNGNELTLDNALETFYANKEAQGIKRRVRNMYKREMGRLLDFSSARNLFTVAQALTLDNLIVFRGAWAATYPASSSRIVVQKHLNHFLAFAYNAGWIPRKPKLSPIKSDAPETQPLTDAEYNTLLGHSTGKVRTLIQLMRWSGLAIRDA